MAHSKAQNVDEKRWRTPMRWLPPLGTFRASEAYLTDRKRTNTGRAPRFDGEEHQYLLIRPGYEAHLGGRDPIYAFFQPFNKNGLVPLGDATPLDRIIWDKWCRAGSRHFAVLSLFTRDMQGNLMLTFKERKKEHGETCRRLLSEVEPSYYRLERATYHTEGASSTKDKKRSANQIFVNGRGIEWKDEDNLVDWVVWNASTLVSAGRCRYEDGRGLSLAPGISTPDDGGLRRLLNSVRKSKHLKDESRCRFLLFKRHFVLLRHHCRSRLATLPMICGDVLAPELKGLDEEDKDKAIASYRDIMEHWDAEDKPSANRRACEAFYWRLCKLKSAWVTAVGEPMRHNLDQVSSVIADDTRRVVLVTGLPGTGKENYCRALHFAGNSCTGDSTGRLMFTTARELLQKTRSVADVLRARFRTEIGAINRADNSGTLIIDELNKVGGDLSDFLRVVEDVKQALNLSKQMPIILAASEHLEHLATIRPKDFWTRVSNQVRVSHPLGRVSEEDARTFLRAYFWWEWWKQLDEWMGKHNEKSALSEHLAKYLLGPLALPPERSRNQTGESVVEIVLSEFEDTLAPLANRDEVSVRGARSMVSQIFARVVWSCRYEFGDIGGEEGSDRDDAKARRAVNRAIQDVLAILNAARATPLGSGGAEDGGGGTKSRGRDGRR